MDHQKGDIFALQKDVVLLGTYETSAFVLSLRDPKEFSTVHSFGFHRIPHIGVYGSDYSVTHPMVLLSLPAVPSCLQNLPMDILNALDLQHIAAQQSAEVVPTPPATKLQFFSEHIRDVLLNHSDNLDSDICSRMIARELVKLVLLSACKRLGLNGHNHLHSTTFMDLNRQKATSGTATSAENGENMFTFSKYRESKRISTVSIMSTDSEPSRKDSTVSLRDGNDITEQSTAKRRPRRQPIIATNRPIEVIMQMEDVEELRLMAKKLVNKVLHTACKRWESLYRRSSIEYLVANTKRMKIASSPSPPPPLLEEKSSAMTSSFVIDSPNSQPKSAVEGSPVHSKGTKRARSGSHEVYMLNELEKFRQAQLHQKLREATEAASSRPRRILTGTRGSSKLQPPSSSENQHLCPDNNSLTVLISNIGRMSIAEADQESEVDSEEGSDEEFTVLSAITKTVLDAEDGNNQLSEDGISRPVSFPTTQTDSTTDSTTCTNRMQNGCLGMEVSGSINDIQLTSNSQTKPASFNKTCNVVPEMDCYVVVHTHPPPGWCQKFLCDNRDEINVLYHCWLFPDIAYDRGITRSEMLDMGVFEPSGVKPVHQDLQDAGIPFYYLDQRTVCIHGCHFSPENAQLQLQSGCQLHTFFSAAKHRNRRVCTYHIIPASDEVERTIRGCVSKCTTLGDLLTELQCWFPEVGKKLYDLILPLSNHIDFA